MNRIPTKKENPEGLHQKYIINKSNGSQIDNDAEYFVLRLDKNGSDPIHIKACRQAVLTYANHIKDHLPQLSSDLINRYGD